jgi:hypothetical protein
MKHSQNDLQDYLSVSRESAYPKSHDESKQLVEYEWIMTLYSSFITWPPS